MCSLVALIGSLWLAGCTAGLVEDEIPEQARPVELSFGHPSLGVGVETRAEPTDESLPAGATLRIAAYHLGEAGTSTSPADFATTKPYAEATYVVGKDGGLSPCNVDADGKVVAGTAKPLSVRAGVYDFYTVSPARPLTNAGNSETPQWQVTSLAHKEDVMTSLARKFTVTEATNKVTLQPFVRKCALVEFCVSPVKTSETITSLKGTALTLTNLAATGAILPAGDATAAIPPTGATEGEAGTIRFVAKDFLPQPPASEKEREPASDKEPVTDLNQTAGVVLPKTAAAFNVSITVSRNGSAATLLATIGKETGIAFEAGKRYAFTLEVDDATTRLQLTITDWKKPAYTDGEAGDSPDDRPSDPELDDGDDFTLTVAEWKQIDWTDPSVGEGENTTE